MNFLAKYTIPITISLFLSLNNNLLAHKGGHKNKPDSPPIGILKGTIIDSISSKPLEYASVSLIDLDHNELVTGGLTDKNGILYIKEIPLGQYIAIIEFIGYEKKEISPINLNQKNKSNLEHDLGKIRLQVSAVNLNTINVLGNDSQFIQTIDKKIFNVGKNLSVSGGSGSDVLRQIPSLNVDIDGIVSIAGDANVTILIDGKKSGRTGSGRRGEVENIDASFIERVEVITNPSAKYDPDGVGGIINIILKRGAFDGFNGSISSMIGERGKQNINTNINYRTDNWNIFGSGNYRIDHKIGNGLRNFEYLYEERADYLHQETIRSEIPKNLSFRLGADFYPSQFSLLGYTLDIANHKDLTKQEFNYTLNTLNPDVIGEIHTTKHDDGFHLDHLLTYENKFGLKDQFLKAYISYSHELDDVHEHGGEETIHNPVTPNEETNAFEHNDNTTFAIDYENKFKNIITIELGAKATLRNYNTDLIYLNNDYDSDYSEDIYAAYLITNYDLTNQFGLKIGLRAEQANTNANLSGLFGLDSTNIITYIIDSTISESPFDNDYFQLYPSFFLLYKLTKNQKFQIGYSKKINRPERRSLSPFPQSTQDFSRLRNGNPYLKPEFSDVIELNYSNNIKQFNLNTTLSYKNTKNVIMWWDRDYMTYNSKTYELITSGNANKAQSLNFNGNIMYRLNSMTNISLWGYGWNSKLSDKVESDFNGNSNGIGYGGRFTINIPSIARFEFSTSGRTKMNITTGTIPGNFRSDLGIQKSFLKNKLSVTLKVTDLFDSGKFIINTLTYVTNSETGEKYQQIMYAERQADKRFASIILNYNFGKKQNKHWNKKTFNGLKKTTIEMDY